MHVDEVGEVVDEAVETGVLQIVEQHTAGGSVQSITHRQTHTAFTAQYGSHGTSGRGSHQTGHRTVGELGSRMRTMSAFASDGEKSLTSTSNMTAIMFFFNCLSLAI